jgi:CelD/BcsL family acetyltransferase involved in cellulose biosynthesis
MSMVQVIRTPEAFEAVAHDWDNALIAKPDSQVFLSSFWLLRWMRAFGDPQTNCILLGRDDDGQIILQAAFERVRERGFRTLRAMTNVHTSRWGVSATEEGMELLGNWVRTRSRAAVARFGRLDIEAGHRNLTSPSYQIEQVDLPLIDTSLPYDDFVASKSRNFRKSLRRSLAKQDHIHTEVRDDGHSCLDAVKKVSSSTWKFKEGTAIVSNPTTETFFMSLLDPTLPTSLVKPQLVLMRDTHTNDESVGFMICLSFNGRLYAIKMGLDERVMEISPGMGALNAVVEHACGDPNLSQIDLDARGPHGDYKLRWSSRTDTLETVLGFAPNAMGRTAHGLWKLKTKLKSSRDAGGAHSKSPGEFL